MSLEIRENRGIFEILGKVSTQQLGALNSYFNAVLEQEDNIVISLEKITQIDTSAVYFFEKLYRNSAKNNKVVSLIGRQNDTLMEMLKTTKSNYILSPDRI
ncbi:MAG: STAS domain-containing protein [Bacteroidota bacterium]